MNTVGQEYLQTAIRRLKYYKDLGDKMFEQLGDKDFHYQPDQESNSIAVIIQHIFGNMLSRWTNFLTEDGEKERRQREEEIEIHLSATPQLIDLVGKRWGHFFKA